MICNIRNTKDALSRATGKILLGKLTTDDLVNDLSSLIDINVDNEHFKGISTLENVISEDIDIFKKDYIKIIQKKINLFRKDRPNVDTVHVVLDGMDIYIPSNFYQYLPLKSSDIPGIAKNLSQLKEMLDGADKLLIDVVNNVLLNINKYNVLFDINNNQSCQKLDNDEELFSLFINEINTDDKVKIYVNTGTEIIGIIKDINKNSILLETNESKQIRIFDKLIGGWEILEKDILANKWWNDYSNEWKDLLLFNLIFNYNCKNIDEYNTNISNLENFKNLTGFKYIIPKEINIRALYHNSKKINFFLIDKLSSNNIKDIEPISKFKSLRTLYIFENHFDLTPISNLVNLEVIILNKNSDNISPLSYLTKLRKLELEFNKQDLTPISNLQNIHILNLQNNNADLLPISKLNNLCQIKLVGENRSIKNLKNNLSNYMRKSIIKDFYNAGTKAEENKNYKYAVTEYTKVIDLDDENEYTRLFFNLAYCKSMYSSNYNEIINDYTKYINLKPNQGSAYNNRGNANYNLGYYDKAIDDYTSAIELKKHGLYYYNRAETYEHFYKKPDLGFDYSYYENKDILEKQIKDYNQAIKYGYDGVNIYNKIGDIYKLFHREKSAIEYYSKSIDISVEKNKSLISRAEIYTKQNKYKLAIGDYKLYLKFDNNYKIKQQLKNVEHDFYEKTVIRKPLTNEWWNNLSDQWKNIFKFNVYINTTDKIKCDEDLYSLWSIEVYQSGFDIYESIDLVPSYFQYLLYDDINWLFTQISELDSLLTFNHFDNRPIIGLNNINKIKTAISEYGFFDKLDNIKTLRLPINLTNSDVLDSKNKKYKLLPNLECLEINYIRDYDFLLDTLKFNKIKKLTLHSVEQIDIEIFKDCVYLEELSICNFNNNVSETYVNYNIIINNFHLLNKLNSLTKLTISTNLFFEIDIIKFKKEIKLLNNNISENNITIKIPYINSYEKFSKIENVLDKHSNILSKITKHNILSIVIDTEINFNNFTIPNSIKELNIIFTNKLDKKSIDLSPLNRYTNLKHLFVYIKSTNYNIIIDNLKVSSLSIKFKVIPSSSKPVNKLTLSRIPLRKLSLIKFVGSLRINDFPLLEKLNIKDLKIFKGTCFKDKFSLELISLPFLKELEITQYENIYLKNLPKLKVIHIKGYSKKIHIKNLSELLKLEIDITDKYQEILINNLPKIETLVLNNNIRDIDYLSNNNLSKIIINNNKGSLDFLRKQKNLEYLSLIKNSVEINFINNLNNLKWIDLSYSTNDISFVKNLRKFDYINIKGCNIDSLFEKKWFYFRKTTYLKRLIKKNKEVVFDDNYTTKEILQSKNSYSTEPKLNIEYIFNAIILKLASLTFKEIIFLILFMPTYIVSIPLIPFFILFSSRKQKIDFLKKRDDGDKYIKNMKFLEAFGLILGQIISVPAILYIYSLALLIIFGLTSLFLKLIGIPNDIIQYVPFILSVF